MNSDDEEYISRLESFYSLLGTTLIIGDILSVVGIIWFLIWNSEQPKSFEVTLMAGLIVGLVFLLFFAATFIALFVMRKDIKTKSKSKTETAVEAFNAAFLENKQKEWEEALKNLETKVKGNETKD